MHYYGMSGFGMGIGWLLLLILIVALIYFVKGDTDKGLSAKDILDKRYAKGEIDEDEYKKKRDALK